MPLEPNETVRYAQKEPLAQVKQYTWYIYSCTPLGMARAVTVTQSGVWAGGRGGCGLN
ncbi:MAG: hypothetical protein IJY23_08820 [Clostridia bacterium]|nr:hypothetical protein [Clostridia bacterium]